MLEYTGMIVELISVGTEILMGNIVNTNAAYLSEKCAGLGLSIYHQITVGDNEGRLMEAVQTALKRADIVILTGGLGPTEDDLTKETTAKAMGLSLVEDSRTKERIAEYFKGRGTGFVMPESNWKQAFVIENAVILDNDNGTAPGMIAEKVDCEGKRKRAILLPGPPNEMKPMFEGLVVPYLKKLNPYVLYSEMVKICGIGESQAEKMIVDLIDSQTNPTIAPYAKTAQVHFRITAKAETEEAGKALIEPVVQELKKRFGDNIYTTREEETLEEKVIALLKAKNYKITTAESLTGGLIAGTLVNVAGASSVFEEGYITYSDEIKEKVLGVSHDTIKKHGAVSVKTAEEMVCGACKVSGANVGIAVTGIAGPDGGTEDTPVGTVYIACSVNGKVTSKHCQFKGNRQKIRDNTVIYALDMVRRELL